MEVLLCDICLFLLLLLIYFISVFNFCLSLCVPPWLYSAWESLCFLDLVDYFLSHVSEVFSYYLFKYFSGPFSLPSPFGTSVMRMLVHLSCPKGLLGCLYFCSFFSLYSVLWQWFPPFCPPGHLSILLPQLFYYWFLLVYYSSWFVCSLVLPSLWYKHFLHLLHCFPEILNQLHYHYSEFFFWKIAYLHFI